MTMAESVALSFATFVVKSLGGFLIQEANNLGGVRPQVEQLQAQLNRMQCFLVAADAIPKGGADEIIIRNCVAEIREASYDAEAAIATFVVKIGRSDQFPFVLKRYLCIFKECLALREVRLEIEAINTRITNSLTTGFQTCGILNSTGVGESSSSTSMAERQRQLRRSYTHIVEEDVVGTEEDVKAVVDLLVKENTNYRVVSIWGMGGLGKTTLAKTVYKHIEISRRFKCVAWAYISEQCNTTEVLKEILIKLLSLSDSDEERRAIGRLNPAELLKRLHQVQSEKKCLVILDDIWKDEDWDSLSPGFPNTTEVGSKILLTTRNENVAKHVDQQCVLYKLRHLTEKESWELFEKKIFLRSNEVIFPQIPPNRRRTLDRLNVASMTLKPPPSPMEIALAATSAMPAVRMMEEDALAPERPAARVKWTVRPWDTPMMMSRTISPSKVRFIHTLQRSDLFRRSVPNGQDLDGSNITVDEAQSRGSCGGRGGGFPGGGGHRERGYGGGGCR